VNLLQPEFVMSVGDLIEGSPAAETNRKQWDDFDRYAKQFQMPFFYCPGNHDFGTKGKNEVWQERLGRPYYHFTYKNTLFLVLNSNDRPQEKPDNLGPNGVGKEQLAYIEKALAANPDVRWTFVFIHHPLWVAKDVPATNWLDVEKLLAGRKHTVFCGHVHTFRKFLRNGTSYYQLATTGGGSALRGIEYGEFDQVAWVTLNSGKDPTIAQIGLSGVMRDDLTPIETNEDGKELAVVANLAEVVGTVKLGDLPGFGLQVNFTEIKPEGQPQTPTVAGTARVGIDGLFTVYQSRGNAGLKPGRYVVTFAPASALIQDGKMRENPVPEKYRTFTTTPYRVDVKADQRNRFEFQLEQ
jgi:hypothetical protein